MGIRFEHHRVSDTNGETDEDESLAQGIVLGLGVALGAAFGTAFSEDDEES